MCLGFHNSPAGCFWLHLSLIHTHSVFSKQKRHFLNLAQARSLTRNLLMYLFFYIYTNKPFLLKVVVAARPMNYWALDKVKGN